MFVASLLFPDETMRALAARLALLRPGARVLSLRRLPEGTPFRPAAFKSSWQQMSWGKAEVFQYTRTAD